MKALAIKEFQQVVQLDILEFLVQLNDDCIYLYDQEGNLVSGSGYQRLMRDFDISDFVISTIYTLSGEDISEQYKKKRKIKEKIWEVLGAYITDKKQKKYRKEINIRFTPNPNGLGIYYAQIDKHKDLTFMNDNKVELLIDLFFSLECYIAKEELPKTLSQYWCFDFNLYKNRSIPDISCRQRVEPNYHNHIYERVLLRFNKDKISHVLVYDLLKRLGENKYYVMELILNDPHFDIDENNFAVYYPVADKEFFMIEDSIK